MGLLGERSRWLLALGAVWVRHTIARLRGAAVVNDLGGARTDLAVATAWRDQVVEKIKAMGGQAVADYGNVAERGRCQQNGSNRGGAFWKPRFPHCQRWDPP